MTRRLMLALILLLHACSNSSTSAPGEGDPDPEPDAPDSETESPAPPDGLDATGATYRALEAGAFLPLSVDGSTIRDAEGREVILRGLQHHSLQDVDYGGREVFPEDYPRIASWGFTTLRMSISWSRIEPTRGTYDSAYLEEIRTEMDRAHDAGLTVILEWHQDLWSRCAVGEDEGMRPNANGAPDWTCPDDYVRGAINFAKLFDRLWADEDGLMEDFLNAWGRVLDAVGTHPALLGLDVINEPSGTGTHPDLEREKVLPGFRAIVPALRQRGARGLLFLDAIVSRGETFEMYAEPFDTLDRDLVYAPHLYSGWLRLYYLKQRVLHERKEEDFRKAAEQGDTFRLPWWNGEWGFNYYVEGTTEDVRHHAGLEDRYRVGSSYWAFQKAVPGQGDDSISGGQSIFDENRAVRADLLDAISRPYPIQTPGSLLDLAYDFTTRTLRVEAEIDDTDHPMVLYAPARHLSGKRCLKVEADQPAAFDFDPETERLAIRFGSTGRAAVTLSPCD